MSDVSPGIQIERKFTVSNVIAVLAVGFGGIVGWVTLDAKVHANTDALLVLNSNVQKIQSDVSTMLLPFSNNLKEHEERLRTLESYVSGAKVQMDNVLVGQERIEKKIDRIMQTFLQAERQH